MQDADWADYFARQRSVARDLAREAAGRGWYLVAMWLLPWVALFFLLPRPFKVFEVVLLVCSGLVGTGLFWVLQRRIVRDLGNSLAQLMKSPAERLAETRVAAAAVARDEGLKTIVEAMVAPSLLVGPEGRILAVNAAGIEVFPAATPGVQAVAVLRDPDCLRMLARAQAGEPSESPLRVAGTPERHFLLHGRPIAADAPGIRPGFVLIELDDLSEGRRLARMRADFLANASHELRTPLAALSGFIETLRGHARDDPAAQEKFLDIMHRQSERMRRLINDLMSLSRIEANELRPPETDIDLVEITSQVVEGLEPVAGSAGVKLETDLPDRPLIVRADADELTQVVQNLVANAIRYSPAGGTVRIAACQPAAYDAVEAWGIRTDPEADRVVLLASGLALRVPFVGLSVSDTGPGISAEYLPRLSERFFRVETGSTGPRTGTGLGLAIVKHSLARSRGGMFVESRVGGGTRFAIALPESTANAPRQAG